MKKLHKVLIANRGEIACRIMRTCEKLMIKTVAVYSPADSNAIHKKAANAAIPLGASESKDSYLNIEKIIQACKDSGADSVHPGYGFLSENGDFVDALEKNGITFIGPRAETIRLMGDKIQAKELAEKAKLPLVPGYQLKLTQDKALPKGLESFIQKTGFPLIIKAAAGGGGRGMRRVDSTDELQEAAKSAAREAEAFFGSPELFIEKLVEDARHIEVQIFGDQHGNIVVLSDRDCTMQRNHQKVIEEAPAPDLSDDVRAALHKAARDIAKAADYTNAGTVEFLLDRDDQIYFLEVNSRLQVEHPVTEAITDLDLVTLQIQIAEGENLLELFPNGEIPLIEGAAIECRLCAEAPENNFAPATGRLEHFSYPTTERSLRVDTGFQSGDTISHYYDSLIAKLIVHSPSRRQAIEEMIDHLNNTQIYGLKTNRAYLLKLLHNGPFQSVTHHTHSAEYEIPTSQEEEWNRYLSALLYMGYLFTARSHTTHCDPWNEALGWRTTHTASLHRHLEVEGIKLEVRALREGSNTFQATISEHGNENTEERSFQFSCSPLTGERLSFSYSLYTSISHYYQAADRSFFIQTPYGTHQVTEFSPPLKERQQEAAEDSNQISSPLPGKIVDLKVEIGSEVSAGETLIVIESMKMEHPLRTTRAGTVKELLIQQGDTVEADSLLAVLEFSS